MPLLVNISGTHPQERISFFFFFFLSFLLQKIRSCYILFAVTSEEVAHRLQATEQSWSPAARSAPGGCPFRPAPETLSLLATLALEKPDSCMALGLRIFCIISIGDSLPVPSCYLLLISGSLPYLHLYPLPWVRSSVIHSHSP